MYIFGLWRTCWVSGHYTILGLNALIDPRENCGVETGRSGSLSPKLGAAQFPNHISPAHITLPKSAIVAESLIDYLS